MARLRQEQVAEMLQLSPSTLEEWRWKRLGPPFIRVSRGCIRYEEEDIKQWLPFHRLGGRLIFNVQEILTWLDKKPGRNQPIAS